MEANYTLFMTEDATADIDAINNYISQNLVNPIAARNLNANFRRVLQLTCSNPFMWPRIQSKDSPDGTIRKITIKNYLIFYRPVEETREIQVLRVIPGMMQYEDML